MLATIGLVDCGAGWILFLVFAGVGFVALPMDLVREWWGRPRATIAKSEYITRAMDMARKAKSVKVHPSLQQHLPGMLSSPEMIRLLCRGHRATAFMVHGWSNTDESAPCRKRQQL